MRLHLLPGDPSTLTVGNSTDSVAAARTVGITWGDHAPATSAGVLNNAVVVMGSATTIDFAFFTVSPAGLVTAITATITTNLSIGSNAIALPAPLTVNSGDYIGIWFNGSTVSQSQANATGFTAWARGVVTKPVAGDTLTPLTTYADFHWLTSAAT